LRQIGTTGNFRMTRMRVLPVVGQISISTQQLSLHGMTLLIGSTVYYRIRH
jgi:hypothetical protein